MTKAQLLEPIPLRPDPGALRERNLKALVRACIASARAKTTESGFSDTDIAKKNWPHDEVAGLIVRASTSPTTLTSANALAQTVVGDLIAATAPVSASATLLDAGLQFSFGRAAYVSVPSFQATANAVRAGASAEAPCQATWPIDIKTGPLDTTGGPTSGAFLLIQSS
jgi:hypothetical protein